MHFKTLLFTFFALISFTEAFKVTLWRYTQHNCTLGSNINDFLTIRPGQCRRISDHWPVARSWRYYPAGTLSAKDKGIQRHCQVELHEDLHCEGRAITMGNLYDQYGNCGDDDENIAPMAVRVVCGIEKPKAEAFGTSVVVGSWTDDSKVAV